MPLRILSLIALPAGTAPEARLLLTARGLRALADGYVSLLLPYYLTLLGFDALTIGLLITATLLGSGGLTLSAGFAAHRWRPRNLLLVASVLTAATGLAMTAFTDFWPLLVVAFVGTLNPSQGDVTMSVPLEHALLAQATPAASRTALFARYSLIGALIGAVGAQCAGLPVVLSGLGVDQQTAIQGMFLLYAVIGVVNFALYRRLPRVSVSDEPETRSPLGKSRRTVYTLAALFSIDAFGGGFAVQSLLALWLFQRFDLSLVAAGTVFFWTGLLAAASFPVAAWLSKRIGLVNTMVYTHLPSNLFMILIPFMPTLPLALALLLMRSALSSMDVPARASYVMAVVSPAERAAAASITNVPRSLASAISPGIAGWLLTLSTFGWPLVACGAIKIVYDLALLAMFRRVRPPEES